VKANLRRRDWDKSGAEEQTDRAAVTIADLTLDPSSRDVLVAGERVRLRQREFDLLEAFMRHPNVAMDRERLLSMVWGEDFYGDARTIDVHVAWLRDKLKNARPKIETVWGVGYKLVPGVDAS
jgi:DNA-binding response OmpR family regulator